MLYSGIDIVHNAHAEIGESPTWSAAEQALYWIDIREPALHRLDPRTLEIKSWSLPSEIGCFTLREDLKGAIVGLRSGLYSIDFGALQAVPLAPPPYDPELFRFNEGGCDSTGRFWLGTMFDPLREHRGDPPEGALYSYTAAGGLIAHKEYALTANGMAWARDEPIMYFSRSQYRTIYAIGFDVREGRLGKRLLVDTVRAEFGIPDGAALDEEGGYWVALHGGWRIRRYRANGEIDREIKLPVSQPTMPAFGGPDLDEMYITSAANGLSAAQKLREPYAGAILRCKPGVRGVPVYAFTG